MFTVTLTYARARLCELLNKVEGGEEVTITRHRVSVARLSGIPRPKLPVRSLSRFRSKMPRWSAPSAELLGKARDEEL